MGDKTWSPYHLASRLFKPAPSLSSRADKLANWRTVLGFVAIAEFREVRANGITWRAGPENATAPTTSADSGSTSDSDPQACVGDQGD